MSRNCFMGRINVASKIGYTYEYIYSRIYGLANDSTKKRNTGYFDRIDISDHSHIEIERNSIKDYDFFTYFKRNVTVELRNFGDNSVTVEIEETVDDGKSDLNFYPGNDSFVQMVFYNVMDDISNIFEKEIEEYKEKDENTRNRIMKELRRS